MPAHLLAVDVGIEGETPRAVQAAPFAPAQVGAWVVGSGKIGHFYFLVGWNGRDSLQRLFSTQRRKDAKTRHKIAVDLGVAAGASLGKEARADNGEADGWVWGHWDSPNTIRWKLEFVRKSSQATSRLAHSWAELSGNPADSFKYARAVSALPAIASRPPSP